jgi:hypothetical protein
VSNGTEDPEHPHFGQAQRDFGGPGRHGLGMSRGHSRGLADDVFASQANRGGTAAWLRQHNWTPIDASDNRFSDAGELVRTAPARRIGDDHHPRNVRAGDAGQAQGLAFEIGVDAATGWIPEWAVTALTCAPSAPTVRWTPARLWSHNPTKLVQLPSGNADFDARWRILSTSDDELSRRVAADPAAQQALLATDDGDDTWTAAGHVAALRPDGHRPELLTHHLQLLSVLKGSLDGP